MIKPATYDFEPFTRGDTFGCLKKTGTIVSVLPLRMKIGIDLTGFTIRMQARKCPDAPVSEIDLSSSNNGIVITDHAAGEFNIKPFLLNVPAGNYSYDMEFSKGTDTCFTFLLGTIIVNPDITR